MSSTAYTVDLEDIKFVLFDQLDIDKRLGAAEKYEDFDQDTYESILEESKIIAEQVLAPINGPGDRQGCTLDGEGNVKTPDGYAEAWRTIAEGGWIGITSSPEVGGMGLPHCVGVATVEMSIGAACAFEMYPGLTGAAARIIHHYGPEDVRIDYATRMFSGEWGGTMCLTEAGAGSSVGDNRCKANRTDEAGVYLLEGEKIFISGADNDFTSNILHLVLARTPDAPAGTKGLSLFLVPKFLINEDGSLGERNDAVVVGIEEKMGIHGSCTCTIALGANAPCKAWIVGEEGEGIVIMFKMMNEARIGVATQGLAIGAAAYNYSVGYCKERQQGTSIANFKDPEAKRVSIIEHPDVRRMLMTQKVQVEAMRSMLYRMAYYGDVADSTDDEALAQKLAARIDLLTPVAKSHMTELGFETAVLAVQCFGGYGFIGEYPVEQCVRDAKIFSIYEGTNGIQAMDLLGRKLRMQGGALFMDWVQDQQTALAEGTTAGFEREATSIGKALGQLGATAMHLGGMAAQGGLDKAMLQACAFQRMYGVVALAMECLDQAVVARKLIAERGESTLLIGKELNLRFYVDELLPAAIALGKGIQGSTAACLDERLWA